MIDSATFNRAAHVLRRVTEETPADAALRAELAANRRLRPDERRAVTRAVFAYYRWRQWLDPRESLQNQVAAAVAWQARFDKNPASIKPEALAERAVPAWLREEFATSADYLRQLQREPALWLRTRTGQTAAVARALGDCAPPPPAADVLGFGFRVLGLFDKLFTQIILSYFKFLHKELSLGFIKYTQNNKFLFTGNPWWHECLPRTWCDLDTNLSDTTHYFHYPVFEHDSRPMTGEEQRFVIFRPIIMGAKGLIYEGITSQCPKPPLSGSSLTTPI